MSKKKRRKLKKKFSFLLFLIIVGFGAYLAYTFGINISLIGDKHVDLTINGDYFENGYSANVFGKSVKVKVTDNINNKKVGKYSVSYTVSLGPIKKTIKRYVKVLDDDKPEIVLKGDEYMILNINDSFTEPGYTASDNLDGDLTDKVKVSGSVDTAKKGKYKISYTVSDSSGNKTKVERTVEVSNDDLLTRDVKDFSLKGYFTDVTLEYEDNEYDYFKDTVFLGDSNTTFLHKHGNYVDGKHTWGKNNLNIAEINASTFTIHDTNKSYTLQSALEYYEPKYMIVQTGISAAMHMDKDTLLEEVEKFIVYMRDNHPNVTVMFSAVFPVYYGSVDTAHMPKVNQYNYFVANLCRKYKHNFINYADDFKTEEGIASKEYFECSDQSDCGFHLNSVGKDKYINYIKHLNFERKVK